MKTHKGQKAAIRGQPYNKKAALSRFLYRCLLAIITPVSVD